MYRGWLYWILAYRRSASRLIRRAFAYLMVDWSSIVFVAVVVDPVDFVWCWSPLSGFDVAGGYYDEFCRRDAELFGCASS